MSEPFASPVNETRGVAIVGMSLGVAILGALRGKGLLTTTQINELLDGALTSMETLLPGDDQSIQVARIMTEAIAQSFVQPPEGLG